MDNVKRPLDSGVLALATTEPSWLDRILGITGKVIVPITNSWAITANKATGSTEMLRRSSRISLEPQTEHPENRTDFKHPDLEQWISENRNQLMRALIVLVMNWISLGKPHPKRVQPLGSYESWSMVLGGILESAGIEGFQGNRRNFDTVDLETGPWRELITRWWNARPDNNLMLAKNLFAIVEEMNVDDPGAFPLRTEKDHARRVEFGSGLMKWRDRVLQIVPDADEPQKIVEVKVVLSNKKDHNAAQWQLVEVVKGKG